MLEIAPFADDFLFEAQALEDLAEFPSVEFVGLDAEVAQRLAVLQLEDAVGDLGEGGPGPNGDQPLDRVLQRLVATLGENGDDFAGSADAGRGAAHLRRCNY